MATKIPINTIRNILTLRYDPLQKPILPKINEKNFQNTTPSIEHIENLVQKYLNNITPKPKKIVIALSGGIDSTLVLYFLRKVFSDVSIEAISVKFADSIDESDVAAKIAKHFDVKHHVIPVENQLKELPKAIGIVGLPFWDLHWYYVSKYAKTLGTHLASGDAGDEIFGGYTFRYQKFLSLANVNSTVIQKTQAYLQCHERDSVPDQENIFTNNIFSWKDIYEIVKSYFDNHLSLIDQVLLADYNGKLSYNFSIVNNRLNEYFGLKTISPFVSEELITYLMSISSVYKYDEKHNLGKLLLRKIISKNNLEPLLSKEKLGFSVNTINLWKSFGHRICSDYLKNARILDDNIINRKWVETHLDRDNLDVRYVNKFLGLFAFEIWYRIFVTKEMNDSTILE